MKKTALFTAIYFIYFTLLAVIGLKMSSVSADVLGTSVTVLEADHQIDIKKIEAEKVSRGGLSSNISLINGTSEIKYIDKVLVTVSSLDGTVEMTESVEVRKRILPSQETILDVEIQGNLGEGDYVALFQLYSNEVLLGKSKTVITIPEEEPKVLGAATEKTSFNYLILAGAFLILFLVTLILLLKKSTWLEKEFNFELEDIVFLIACLSAFGLGFLGVHFLLEKILTPEIF